MKAPNSIKILVIFYLIILAILSSGQTDSDSSIPKPTPPPIIIPSPEPPPIIMPDKSDTSEPVTSSSSYSKGSYYLGPYGPAITVEKNIKTKTETYYKNDDITIRLRILNCNQRNRLESVHISEEIPSAFEMIKAKPDKYIERNADNDPKTIEWRFDKGISSKEYIEYTIRTGFPHQPSNP